MQKRKKEVNAVLDMQSYIHYIHLITSFIQTNNSILIFVLLSCPCAAAFKQLCPYGHGAVPGLGEGRVGKTHMYCTANYIIHIHIQKSQKLTTKASSPFKWIQSGTLLLGNREIEMRCRN